jgi:hypothetical protein
MCFTCLPPSLNTLRISLVGFKFEGLQAFTNSATLNASQSRSKEVATDIGNDMALKRKY